MLAIGKVFEFCASHRLYRPDWSVEQNTRVFGKCANPNGHGHNYKLEVCVHGTPNPETGMVMDASLLSKIVDETIFQHVDHKNLDIDVPWLSGTITTSENLVRAFWERLAPVIRDISTQSASLFEIKLWETSKIFALKRSV